MYVENNVMHVEHFYITFMIHIMSLAPKLWLLESAWRLFLWLSWDSVWLHCIWLPLSVKPDSFGVALFEHSVLKYIFSLITWGYSAFPSYSSRLAKPDEPISPCLILFFAFFFLLAQCICDHCQLWWRKFVYLPATMVWIQLRDIRLPITKARLSLDWNVYVNTLGLWLKSDHPLFGLCMWIV